MKDSHEVNKRKAHAIMMRKSEIGKTKQTASQGAIRSIGTQVTYQNCVSVYLNWACDKEISHDHFSKLSNVELFFEERRFLYVQATINKYKSALAKAFEKKIPFALALKTHKKERRAYSHTDFESVMKCIPDRFKISAQICYWAGLRAKELASLERASEGAPTSARVWSNRIFEGMTNYTLYLVIGKGGLKRQVAIPNLIATQLESLRLATPVKVVDRGVYYYPIYNLEFGKRLSGVFSRSSKKALGRSTGLHGLRHSYAQRRIFKDLAEMNPLEARLIVSQEMGHFRPEIVETYLR